MAWEVQSFGSILLGEVWPGGVDRVDAAPSVSMEALSLQTDTAVASVET